MFLFLIATIQFSLASFANEHSLVDYTPFPFLTEEPGCSSSRDECVGLYSAPWDQTRIIDASSVDEDGTIFIAAEPLIYRSTDNGSTWQPLGAMPAIKINTLLSVGENELYSGTDGSGVFKSIDFGASWFADNSGIESMKVNALFQTEDKTLLGVGEQGVFLRSQELNTWRKAAGGFEGQSINSIAESSQGKIYIGSSKSGVWMSLDGGKSWTQTSLRDANVLVLSSLSNGMILAGTESKGILLGRDDAEWQNIGSFDIPIQAVSVHPQDDNTIYLGTSDGLYWSNDLGAHWNPAERGLTKDIKSISQHLPGTMLVVATGNVFREENGFFIQVTLSNLFIGFDLIARIQETPSALSYYFMILLAALLGLISFTYFAIARPKGLPIPAAISLLPKPAIWTKIRKMPITYQEYLTRIWREGSYLDQLIVGYTILDAFSEDELQEFLNSHNADATSLQINSSLENLCDTGILGIEDGKFRFVVWPYFSIAKRLPHESKSASILAKHVREENPNYRSINQFFSQAGFRIRDLNSVNLLLSSEHPNYKKFGDIHVCLCGDKPLHVETIRDIHEEANKLHDGNLSGRIAFAVVAKAPESGARFQIYAYRSEHNFTIIPIGQAAISRALQEGTSAAELDIQIRQYLGESDLYGISTPVTDVLSFFGRSKIIDEIIEYLNRWQPIGLFGIRKMGKTSLIGQLKERLSDCAVAVLDLQNTPKDCNLIYTQIVREFVRDIEFKNPDSKILSVDGLSSETDPVSVFSDSMLKLHDAWSDNQQGTQNSFILILDEVDRMLPTESDAGFQDFEPFLAALRGLFQQHRFLIPIVISVDPSISRTSRWDERDNPMFKFFKELFLSPFEREECFEMITNIGEQMGMRYDNESLELLFREANGHPFVTRQLCSIIVSNLESRPAQVSKEHVLQAIEGYFERRDTYFESTWEHFDTVEEQIMLQLADVGFCSQIEIINRLSDSEKKGKIRDALLSLTEKHIIQRKEDQYTIGYALMRKWICFELLDYEYDELHDSPGGA
jgi:hypothetical protein